MMSAASPNHIMDKGKGNDKNEVHAKAIESSALATPLSGEVPAPEKQKSLSSFRSEDRDSHGREISDTLSFRFLYLAWAFVAIILESILLSVLNSLHSVDGLTLSMGGQTFEQTVPVVIELWMHMCYIATDAALTKSLTAYFGYLLSQPEGFSLVVCGFIQSGLSEKIQFSNLLNFRSKFKKIISRASTVWLIHILMIILSFFPSTSLLVERSRFDKGNLLCVEYGQDGLPVDRGWPTLDTTAGVAEFLFGTSLGHLSSEEGIDNSTLITYPQLVDVALDGTRIKGMGFTTNLQTHCDCAPSNSITDLIYVGTPPSVASTMRTMHSALLGGPGWVNFINYTEVSRKIEITSILSGYYVCGGTNYVNKSVSVCKTVVGSHDFAKTKISWMNDGVPVRSTAKKAELLETTGPANMTWLYIGLRNAMGGDLNSYKLPGFYPGTVNPLLWWTTPNLQTLSGSFLNTGLETTFCMLLKLGITRTYSIKGNSCTQNVADYSRTTFHITESGYQIGVIFVVFELILAIIAIIGCIPWFLSENPVIPAMRLVSDRTYFNIMLCKNSTGNMLRMIGSTSDRTNIWPKLDMAVRVGENIQTVANLTHGEIIVDKPKLVTNLAWNKRY